MMRNGFSAHRKMDERDKREIEEAREKHRAKTTDEMIAGHIRERELRVPKKREIKLKDLLEALADLEHEQWMKWANSVKGEVDPERAKRWEGYMVPYSELSEEVKDMDREWAKKVVVCLIEAYIRGKKEK